MRWLGVGALAAFLLGAAPLSAQTEKPKDIVLALPAFALTFAIDYLAEDTGIYARHGLHVKTIEIAGVGAINAVISGSVDFAQPSAASFTRAAAHGQRLLAIVETLNRPAIQVVLRREIAEAAGFDAKAPLEQRARVLRGRTVAVESINSLIHAYVKLIARRAQYDPEEIHIAVMQPTAMLAAFAARQIDGFAITPPWTLKPVLEGTAVMVADGPSGDPADLTPLSNNVVVARPETCEKRKPLCEQVGAAFAEAASFLRDHRAEALILLKKRFPTLEDGLIAASFDVIRRMTPVPPAVTRAGLENSEIMNVDAGLLKPEDKLKSYDDLFTDRYVR